MFSPSAAAEPVFRDYFWTLLIDLIPYGLKQPATCLELFQLAVALFKSMKESKSNVLNLPRTIQFLSRLLLDYKPQEVGSPDPVNSDRLFAETLLYRISYSLALWIWQLRAL